MKIEFWINGKCRYQESEVIPEIGDVISFGESKQKVISREIVYSIGGINKIKIYAE